MTKTKVADYVGSRSVEHGVSVVTAMQIFEAINRNNRTPDMPGGHPVIKKDQVGDFFAGV